MIKSKKDTLRYNMCATRMKFLITGSSGQVGRALIPKLQAKYGKDTILATDVVGPTMEFPSKCYILNVMHPEKLERFVVDFKVTQILHFASTSTAISETMPEKAIRVNMRGLENVFDVALKYDCGYYQAITQAQTICCILNSNIREMRELSST
eukprot:TRINITY_DN71921_c0_g1_i1.p3 TRINITY_DN71921_c0_g1~~TRINITY_DN71921_c0_g1_i1.p3  ORF type:complete len:171 (-),score=5.43 TRINITY_DN71921_c0_g1_i1:617-1075(-)